MGSLILPLAGLVYLDANSIIYTVEKHPDYSPLLLPLWLASQAGSIEVVTSELTLLECSVGPLKRNDDALLRDYQLALLGTEIRLLPVTRPILLDAAKLRATVNVKTPDAIHGATAVQAGCSLLVTNDAAFRRIAGLSVAVLNDLLTK